MTPRSPASARAKRPRRGAHGGRFEAGSTTPGVHPDAEQPPTSTAWCSDLYPAQDCSTSLAQLIQERLPGSSELARHHGGDGDGGWLLRRTTMIRCSQLIAQRQTANGPTAQAEPWPRPLQRPPVPGPSGRRPGASCAACAQHQNRWAHRAHHHRRPGPGHGGEDPGAGIGPPGTRERHRAENRPAAAPAHQRHPHQWQPDAGLLPAMPIFVPGDAREQSAACRPIYSSASTPMRLPNPRPRGPACLP